MVRYKRKFKKVIKKAGSRLGKYGSWISSAYNAADQGIKLYDKFKTAQRKHQSDSKSYTRTKSSRGGNSIAHSGFTSGRKVIGKLRVKRFGKNGQWRYQQNHSNQYIGTAGLQVVQRMAGTATYDQLWINSGGGYSIDQNAWAVANMNPNRTNTGSSVIDIIVSPLNDKFYLNYINVKQLFSNMSGVGARVDIYCVTPKYATNESINNCWTDDADAFAEPTAVPSTAGLAAVTLPGSINIGIPFVRPTDNSKFRRAWRVCGVKTFKLSGNSTFELDWNLNINKVISRSKMEQAAGAATIQYWPGITHLFFAVIVGQVVLDETNGPGGTHYATTGQVSLASVTTTKYFCSAVKNAAARLDVTMMASQIPSGVTRANQTMLNEIDVPTDVGAVTQF